MVVVYGGGGWITGRKMVRTWPSLDPDNTRRADSSKRRIHVGNPHAYQGQDLHYSYRYYVHGVNEREALSSIIQGP